MTTPMKTVKTEYHCESSLLLIELDRRAIDSPYTGSICASMKIHWFAASNRRVFVLDRREDPLIRYQLRSFKFSLWRHLAMASTTLLPAYLPVVCPGGLLRAPRRVSEDRSQMVF